MTLEQSILAHLKWLIDTDRAYAQSQIPWYWQTAPWLEASIGPALREHWKATTVPEASS